MESVKEYIAMDLILMAIITGIIVLLSITVKRPMDAIIWIGLMFSLVGVGYLLGYKIGGSKK